MPLIEQTKSDNNYRGSCSIDDIYNIEFKDNGGIKRQTIDNTKILMAADVDNKLDIYRVSRVPEIMAMNRIVSELTYSCDTMSCAAILSETDLMPSTSSSSIALNSVMGLKKYIELERQNDSNLLKLPKLLPKKLPKVLDPTPYLPNKRGYEMRLSKGGHIYVCEQDFYNAVRKIVTTDAKVGEPINPSICNVMSTYKYFSSKEEYDCVAERCLQGNICYAEMKQILAMKLTDTFTPIKERYRDISDSDVMVRLVEGEEKMRATANMVLKRFINILGL